MSVKFKELKKGEKLSETQYYSVIGTGKRSGKDYVELSTDEGTTIILDPAYVEKYTSSSHQYSQEKTISRTEAASLFIASTNTAITVNFNKQVDEKAAKQEMYELYPNKGKMISEADFKKKIDASVKSILSGKERTIIGRHYGSVNEFGRVNFVDMEVERDNSKDFDNRMRQVDPRSINWMIIKDVKYKIKK